ncbi:hypothetical protein RHMOL_Rhmol10G0071200 [Rhododendron molle]|uniref:Uncharacterized protein n=1 Tax=Rhododendron molle TaxID=49168 RepID=A0ACC0M0Z1_RHOML|nr:hypothetical protein RHMOL_Rhmol10G0071200 [Rhododendron molle]
MLEIQNCGPAWLRQLLKANFYLVCQIHKDYKYNRCNRFCINCTGNPFCEYCLDDHKNHQIIQHEVISHGFARQTFAVGTELSAGKMDDSLQVDESSTPDRKLKVRRLDKLVAKSSVVSASVTKQVTSSICLATASVFNHANSRKRKGIPQRAPLMVLYNLDELVCSFVHKILAVIESLLIHEDYYARIEVRKIISNLSKAASLATMIAKMRLNIDNIDEYVRNTTARAFSVVAYALEIPALLPFLKVVCQNKKSWQARHTSIKIIQNYRGLVETTVEIANKVGVADIIGRIVEDLKDDSEPYKRTVMETIEKVVANLGASDIDARLVELLIDGILYAFQEHTNDDANVMLNGFDAVVNALAQRVKPYLAQIHGTIEWHLNN